MATGSDFELRAAAEVATAGFADTDLLASGVSTIFHHVDDPRFDVFRTARKDLQNLFKQFAEVHKEASKLPESDYNSTEADDEVFENVQDVDGKRVNFCIALVQWIRALTNMLDGHNENDRIYLINVAQYVERKKDQLKLRPFLIEENKKSEEMNAKCVLPTTSQILPAMKRLCLDDTFDSTQPHMKNPRQVSPSCFTEMDEGETQPEIAIDGYLAPPGPPSGMVPPPTGDATRPRLTSTSRRLSFGIAAAQMSQQDQELAEKRQQEAQSRAEQYERERVAAEEAERKLAERMAQMEEKKKAMAYQEEIRKKEAAARKAAEEEKAKEEEREKAS